MKGKSEPWYVYLIVALSSGVATYFAFDNYDEFIHPPDWASSPRSRRLMILILNIMDKIGGKWFAVVALFSFTIYLLIRSYAQFRSGKR